MEKKGNERPGGANDFTIVSGFTNGYRNREDVTVLPPGVLVEGSQNVLTDTFQHIGIRKGYTLDGQSNTDLAPIAGGGPAMGVFDWQSSNGNGERNMRAGFLTSAGNDGKMQFRTVASDGTVTWIDLFTDLTSVDFNYITFWDKDLLQTLMLCVNGENNIRSWSGALVEISAATNDMGIIGGTYGANNIENATAGEFASGGVDYVAGDLLAIAGGNNDAIMQVDTVVPGGVKTVSVNVGGSSYTVGDYVSIEYPLGGPIAAITAIPNPGTGYNIGDTITTGTGNAIIQVTQIFSGGAVQTLQIIDRGSGYTSASAQATSPLSPPTGGGTGLTISYTASGGTALLKVTGESGGVVNALQIITNGLAYAVDANIPTTNVLTSGSPSGLTVNINTIGNTIFGWHLKNNGTGYSASTDFIPQTTTGGTGTNATIFIPLSGIITGRVTIGGTKTLQQLGFAGELTPTDGFGNTPVGGSFISNNVTYAYASLGDGGFSFVGVDPDPSVIPNGSIVAATGIVWTNGDTILGISDDFQNDLIGTLNARVFIGSLTSSFIYLSDYVSFKIYNDALTFILTNPPRALIPQQDAMYVSAGKDEWYKIDFLVSADLTATSAEVYRLNTTPQQASQGQGATTKIQNNIAFLSFEPVIESFGPVTNILLGPQMSDLSYSIVNLMNNYDFTGAGAAFFRKMFYLAVPREGVVLIYNMTDAKNPYWEAPQVMPISRFSIIDGELYGHSSAVSETYKLFTGTNDNGFIVSAAAVFSFNNYGTRTQTKGYNEFYVEGYISNNTELNLGIQYDIDGCATKTNFDIDGDDAQIVCLSNDEASLGKTSLGKHPLGSSVISSTDSSRPKFRVIKTFPINYFYEDQISFSSEGLDEQWEIIAFGPQLQPFGDLNNSISQ